MSSGPSKIDLMKWADERREVDLISKVILQKFAGYASEDGDTWCKVETLADHANCSVRTLQSRLSALKESGYLFDTGRTHRLKRSTRSVPIYLLQPSVEAAEPTVSMGANSAPIAGYGCKESGGMGATARTPKDTKEPNDSSDELSTRAREREAVFDQIEDGYPRAGIGVSDRSQALRAFHDLADRGVDIGALPAAAARYAADPMLKRRDFGPVSLQRWLGEGRYRGWLEVAAAPSPTASRQRTAFAGPADLKARIEAEKGEVFVTTYLDPAAWDDEAKILTPFSVAGARKLAEVRHIIRDFGASIGAPITAGQVAGGKA